ncbi:MAG TPA: 4'-phosphopantetheinyl transferase superfamily protein [Burkholderiaceae bacterium]|nr:4'-phosphopantetheinyl transferase superfamily protein [Burkholderiaceae bacterium]
MNSRISVARTMQPLIPSCGGFAQPPAGIDAAFESGQVHVWRIDLDRFPHAAWNTVLRPEDVQRAGRFVRQVHRDRFLQCRFCLLTLLSAYTGCAGHELDLRTNEHGKPYLPPEYRLGFNLSHSENLAVIAIGRAPAIGIDIERPVPPQDIHALARQVLSEQENAAFEALPQAQALLSFFVCWTRKEAFLKAVGAGLTLDPRHIHVGLTAEPLQVAHGARSDLFEVTTIDSGHAIVSLAVGHSTYRGRPRIRDYHPTFCASETQP